jgi:hypothetical protein
VCSIDSPSAFARNPQSRNIAWNATLEVRYLKGLAVAGECLRHVAIVESAGRTDRMALSHITNVGFDRLRFKSCAVSNYQFANCRL